MLKSTELLNKLREMSGGKLDQKQVDAIYVLIEKAGIQAVADLIGYAYEAPTAPETPAFQVGKFTLSERSLSRLNGVNAGLVSVVKRAIQLSDIDFMVIEGVRTNEQAYINWGKGRTVAQLAAKKVPNPEKYAKPNENKVTWLSNPLASKHIKGLAVDLAPLKDGVIDWNDIGGFLLVDNAMKQAAKELNVKIQYGGDWAKNKDYPHWEV